MEVSTAITLLTINLIILSIVIMLVIIAVTVLVIKLNKIAKNVKQTTDNVASLTDWLSPAKLIGEVVAAIQTIRNDK